ncbi:DNA translocase FtsK [Bacillus gobiensis]|uniref:DNA translocase FtsK n=1 Tax=Bacillus gobiensis TaxID=1441095 RepID=UPI003D1D1F8C
MSWLTKIFSLGSGQTENYEEQPFEHEPYDRKEEYEDKLETGLHDRFPNQGKFRFPLIKDDEEPAEQAEPTQYNPKNQSKETISQHSANEKKAFKPTVIPSPIYGFKQRQETPIKDFYRTSLSKEEERDPLAGKNSNRDRTSEKSGLGLSFEVDSSHEDIIETEEALQQNAEKEEPTFPFVEAEQSEEESRPRTEVTEKKDDETEKPLLITEASESALDGEPAAVNDSNRDRTSEKRDLGLSFEVESSQEDNIETEESLQQNAERQEPAFPFVEAEQSVEEPAPHFEVTEKKEDQDEKPVLINEESASAIDGEPKAPDTKIVKNTDRESPTVVQSKQTPITASGQKKEESSNPFNVLMLASDKRKGAGGSGYRFPELSLLDVPAAQRADNHNWVNEQKELLNRTLKNFHVNATVVRVTQGPTVTRYEVHPEPGVKVNKITNLADDIKLSLSARDIRIEAPIPGKNTIGIEVPNKESKMVYIREMIRSKEFRTNDSPLTAALGMDIAGTPVVLDLKKMPHGLIAGSTGSGKSVCLNTILVSLLYKSEPSEVKLLLIDPKMVELAPYHEIPHLVSPVITDPKAATAALKWVVEEMERRYQLFAHSGVRDLTKFNQKVQTEQMGEKLPYLVVVIDELADLMMVAPGDVEESICRIAQKARACGIHLLIATQRPSVDVITGLIKANISTRIAFSVSSQVDSRTIIDVAGAEKLLGKGDMLFLENGSGKPVRLQGNFVSDGEIERAVSHVRKQMKPSYLFEQEELMSQTGALEEEDELFLEACHFALEQGHASTSSLQRRFRVGYNRAARLIDMMEREGFISSANGSKPRDLLITKTDFTQWVENQ